MVKTQQPPDFLSDLYLHLRSRPRGVVGLVAAVYFLAYAIPYSGTALGLNPVLDGREMLQLALAIMDGNLSPEPFYRAPLYPLILAPLSVLTGEGAGFILIARLLNGCLHVLNAVLVFEIALRIWRNRMPALLAGLLYALYPISVFFAADLLDITLAVTLMLASLLMSFRAMDRQCLCNWIAAGALLAAGILARPHLVPVGLLFPIAGILARYTPFRSHSILPKLSGKEALAWFLPIASGFLLFGVVNKAVSGEFVLLPTQGGFNLWAANNAESNGRYFEQTMEMPTGSEHENPAAWEARIRYIEETGKADGTPTEISTYWRGRAVKEILSDPAGFAGLFVQKVYALFHPYEQYNNKTFSWAAARFPSLGYNPIGWRVLLPLALFVCIAASPNRKIVTILVWMALFAAGVLLYFASARFRFPLASLFCCIVGGLAAPQVYGSILAANRRSWIAAGCALVILLLGLTNFFEVRSTETHGQDFLLNAQAAYELGDDETAFTNARSALEKRPGLHFARELLILSRLNMAFDSIVRGVNIETDFWRELLALGLPARSYSAQVDTTLGIAAWRLEKRNLAVELWRSAVATEDGVSDLAELGLFLIGENTALGDSNEFYVPAMRIIESPGEKAADPTEQILRVLFVR